MSLTHIFKYISTRIHTRIKINNIGVRVVGVGAEVIVDVKRPEAVDHSEDARLVGVAVADVLGLFCVGNGNVWVYGPASEYLLLIHVCFHSVVFFLLCIFLFFVYVFFSFK